MSSQIKNLSSFNPESLPSSKGLKIGIVVSEWNTEITDALYKGAFATLVLAGVGKADITKVDVPGSFELCLAGQWLAEKGSYDAIICLGCVIQGETRHFEFICQAVAKGLTDLSLKFSIPFIFGVLTPDTQQQALDRAGGKHGNKGVEAAVTAIKMLALKKSGF